MKKIKCPEIVLDICFKVSQLISRNCILIMVGPIPQNEIRLFNLNLTKLNDGSYFKYKTQWKNLTILWTGVEFSVEYLLQISDVELNASLHDSFNVSLMEAMACGVPVVTSNVVGIKEHILTSNAGYCFPTVKLNFDDLNKSLHNDNIKTKYFDIDYAVSAIQRIATDSILSTSFGNAGAKYVLTEFSYENASREFYKQLL
jgi:glycosyltransferase involved in cell wall biosynthesis